MLNRVYILCVATLLACDLDRGFAPGEFACREGRVCHSVDPGNRLDGGQANTNSDTGRLNPGGTDATPTDGRADSGIADGPVVSRDANLSPDASDGGPACDAGSCSSTACCAFGERCVNGSCEQDSDPWLCQACGNQRDDCGGKSDLCFTNPNYVPGNAANGPQFYCSIRCDPFNGCPNGYTCQTTRLAVTPLCGNDNECAGPRSCMIDTGNSRGSCSCLNSDDCKLQDIPPACLGTCSGTSGLNCRTTLDCDGGAICETNNRRCQSNPSRACVVDQDCDSTPLCQNGFCVTDLSRCSTGADCRCRQGLCIGSRRACQADNDCNLTCNAGLCEVGMACSPAPGLSCDDL